MIRLAIISTFILLTACALGLYAGGPAEVHAQNRILGLQLQRDQERTRCVIRLEARPLYTLKASHDNRIRLLLPETERSSALLEGVKDNDSILALDPEIAEPNVGILFTLPSAVQDLSAAWLPDRAELSLELVHNRASPQEKEDSAGEAVLRPIHFGFMDERTRMVLGLDRHPAWELSHLSRDRIRLHLPLVRPELEQKRYGPAKNLALATLRTEGKNADIDIRLLTGIDRIRIFWTQDGAHLVTDLFEGEPIPRPSSEAPTSGTTSTAVKPERGNTHENRPNHASASRAESTTTDGNGPIFRGRIPSHDNTPPDPSPEGPGQDEVRPEPEGISENDLLRELNPDQVLLYGDIQQAVQDGRHEETADLCGQFLNRFPESPLVEKVFFLKGNAEFALLEGGDKKRFSDMMKTYRKAISQFRLSPEVPRAYLNMARASSLVGNDHAAIGYLNIVLHGAYDSEDLALTERGRMYLKINRPDKAIEDFKAVLKDHPDSPLIPEVRMGVARYYEAMGLHDKAGETLEALFETYPQLHLDHPEFLFLRGKNALYLERYDLARDFFFRALNTGGQTEGADLLLARIGDTFHHASKPSEAEAFYHTVIRDYPDSDGASIAKLRLAGYENGYQGFQALREENLNKPVGDMAVLEMARKYYEETQYAKALEVVEELLNKPFQNDINMEAKRLFFRAAEQEILRLYKEGKYQALVDFYRTRQRELGRNIDPETVLLVGLSLHRLEKHIHAAELLGAIKPYDLNQVSKGLRVLTLVKSLLEEGEEEQALAQLEKREEQALLPAADQQKLDLMLADLYRERGRRQEAYDLYRGLVEGKRLLSDRDIAFIYLEMGRFETREGDLEQARTSLNRCIGLAERSNTAEPVLRQAYAELGAGYFQDRRYHKALQAFEQAINEGYEPGVDGYWKLRFQMAQAYLETGEHDRAETLLMEISEQGDGPLQQRVRIRLGMLGLEEQLQRLSGWSK